MKKLLILLFLATPFSIFAYSPMCFAPYELIKSKYSDEQSDLPVNYKVVINNKSRENKVEVGRFSLFPMYTPVMSSPGAHVFNYTVDNKITKGLAYISQNDKGVCELILVTSEKEGDQFYQNIFIDNGVLKIYSNETEGKSIIPTSDLEYIDTAAPQI